MTKNHNMGRKSHLAQDNELNQNRPAADAELNSQPTRASQHPQQGTKASGEEPMRRHGRRGN